ncbi:MAG: L-dopachrome tautomerase-related protein, partial [Pseudomonadota bacterium]
LAAAEIDVEIRGERYPDLTTAPRLGPADLELAVSSDRPIGNVAVAPDGMVYFTIHPEANPSHPKLYRAALGGRPEPWPATNQEALFDGPLGVVIDGRNRLWLIDPATHGTGAVKLLALDLATGDVVHEHVFDRAIAPLGSFVQDLQIDAAGETVYVADVGFWAQRPALIVYDVASGAARRVLNRHPSVTSQQWIIHNQIKRMEFFGGLMAMKVGVDGLALSRDGAWLYYAAMTHDEHYRIRTSDLKNAALDDEALAARIEPLGPKPINDGMSTDAEGAVYFTDVENQAVVAWREGAGLETVVKDERIRWADALSFGPEGWLYLADSAIPHLVLQSPEHIAEQAPYAIWRFKPGGQGAPGQ